MMAMNVKNRGAYFQSSDYCRDYNSPAISYGSSSHYFPRLPGPEALLKPPLDLMCPAPPHFQPAPPPPSLGPPPEPLFFTLPAEPLSLAPGPPPSPTPPEEEGQSGATDQDSTLEELCRPLYCKLCNVTLNSAQQAQAHYQGKNHSKKLRNFYAGSQQPPPVRIPEEPVTEQPLAPPPAESAAPCKQTQAVFKGASRVILATESDYCKLCDASFSSPTVAQAHYQGKNHAKRLRLNELQSVDSSECNHRRVRTEGAEFKLKTRKITHFSPNLPGPYYNPRPRQRIPRDLAMCVTPSGQYYCSMCNSGAGEEADFRLHLESKQHKSRMSERRYRSEMQTLGYT